MLSLFPNLISSLLTITHRTTDRGASAGTAVRRQALEGQQHTRARQDSDSALQNIPFDGRVCLCRVTGGEFCRGMSHCTEKALTTAGAAFGLVVGFLAGSGRTRLSSVP